MGILVSIVGGFASGVFLRSLFIFEWAPIVFILILATLFALARIRVPRLAYSLGAIFCICVALGMTRTLVADTPLPQTFAYQLHRHVTYEGVVVSDPDLRDASQRFGVRVTSGGESAKMLVVTPRYPTIVVGDRVRVTGVLLVPQPFASESGRVFRYDKYLERDGVRFIMSFAFVRIVAPAPWYSLPSLLARAKHRFLDGLAAALPEPVSSLAGGIVIGGRSGLGSTLQEAFVRSGLIQIIVLSGYNVMVVAEWVMILLASVGLSRRWQAISGALAVIAFVGVAGASATAVRAMCMACIALYARATGRTYAAGRALLLVVLLMLVWNPLYLVYDPGFDLSVVATAGLIWLAPRIEAFLPARGKGHWASALATTLAAQVAVFPLLLYETGNLSLVAVPANLLVAPIVPLAMGLSALAGLAGMLFGTFAPLVVALAFPAYLTNAYLLVVAVKAASLPLAAFTIPHFSFAFVVAAYAALILIASSKRFSTTVQLRLAKKAST